jgi:hypothetical protein
MGNTKSILRNTSRTTPKKKLKNEILFVSPDEFFVETQIKVTKMNETIMYNQETNTYDKSYNIVFEREEDSTIYCCKYLYILIKIGVLRYIIDINGIGFPKTLEKEVVNLFNFNHSILEEEEEKELYKMGISPVNVNYILKNEKRIIIPQEVRDELERLNKIINCTKYRLAFDYGYNLGDGNKKINSYSGDACIPMLCLFNGQTCVSSVEITKAVHNPLAVNISSFSNPSIRMAGINKLIRAAAIFISSKLNPDINFIESIAENPISAHILLNSLNGYVLRSETIDKTILDLSQRSIPFEQIKRYTDTGYILNIEINIRDPDTLVAAERVFNEVASSEKFRASCNVALGEKRKSSRRVRKKPRSVHSKKKQIQKVINPLSYPYKKINLFIRYYNSSRNSVYSIL